jgi:hypothetical protein
MNAMTATAVRRSKMTTYTIDAENSITALGSQQADFEGEIFASQEELADLAANWPANRLIDVWNGIPGLTPIKKFTDRKSAVGRIWKAIQNLDGGNPAEQATTAPERANKAKAGGKKGKKAKSATKPSSKAARGKRAKVGNKPAAARDGSKKAEVLGLLQRKGGTTLAQIMKATGWHAHSVRGFISGALGEKMGLTVNSARREDGERVYSIAYLAARVEGEYNDKRQEECNRSFHLSLQQWILTGIPLTAASPLGCVVYTQSPRSFAPSGTSRDTFLQAVHPVCKKIALPTKLTPLFFLRQRTRLVYTSNPGRQYPACKRRSLRQVER